MQGASQMLWSQYQAGGRRKHRLMQSESGFYALSSSSLGTFQTPPLGDHDPFSGAASVNLMHPFGYFVKLEDGLVIHQSPAKDLLYFAECENRSKMPSTLDSKYDRQHMESVDHVRSEIDASKGAVHKTCHRKQSHVSLDIKNPCDNYICQVPSSDKFKLQDKSFTHQGEVKMGTKLLKTVLGTTMSKIGCSTIHEKNMIKLSSDDVSLGSASFRRLQNELGQVKH